MSINIVSMSYDEIRDRLERLSKASEQRMLHEDMLDRAVELVVEDKGDGPPKSIGFCWIRDHIPGFLMVVSNVLAFMRRHLGNRYFASLVILYTELLELIPEEERASYIRESVMGHGSWNTGWVKAALEVGVSEQVLAQIVLDRLEATTEEEMRYACFLWEFLRYGAGQIERANRLADALVECGGEEEARHVARSMQRTKGMEFVGRRVSVALERNEDDRRQWRLEEGTSWSVLSDGQFAQAMMICARKAPNEVLNARDKIRLRLDDERLEQVMIEAADHLDSPCCLKVLSTLPLETRLALARRIKKAGYSSENVVISKFLVNLIMTQGGSFYEEMSAILDQIDAALLYRNTWQQMHDAECSWLSQKLWERLTAAGYVIGTIEEGFYRDRRTRQHRRQMQVQHEGITYVRDRQQHRYFPKIGDRVLFNPTRGFHLTPKVVAVIFYPAYHGGKA